MTTSIERPASHFSTEDAELTQRLGIVDSHNDFATAIAARRADGDYCSLAEYWLPRFRAGGLAVVVAPVWISSLFVPEGALRRAVQVVDGLLSEIEAAPDEVALVKSYAEIERARSEGKVGILLAFEGAEPLGHDLAALRLFHAVGLRMLSLTWSRRNAFGDGAWENESRGGLTRLGKEAIHQMDRLGIIVDVSHASDETARDVLAEASGPVVASHSNARALRNHPRNLPDELLKGIAASGGVIGLTAVPSFIDEGPATIGRWADHLTHVIELVGIEHVGIGADFIQQVLDLGASLEIEGWGPDWGKRPPRFDGMLSPEDLPGLTAELRRRGFSEQDLARIYHGNYFRVFERVLA
ncbi:MAG TPA: dipeptidase [Chloroflexota bacterium]|nr:dipeptidase [Chloroflexota bacterium]